MRTLKLKIKFTKLRLTQLKGLSINLFVELLILRLTIIKFRFK